MTLDSLAGVALGLFLLGYVIVVFRRSTRTHLARPPVDVAPSSTPSVISPDFRR